MQGMKRRIVYVILFEVIAIVITTYGFAFITGRDIGESSIAATITSVLAIVWNLSYNALFEFVEAKQYRQVAGLPGLPCGRFRNRPRYDGSADVGPDSQDQSFHCVDDQPRDHAVLYGVYVLFQHGV